MSIRKLTEKVPAKLRVGWVPGDQPDATKAVHDAATITISRELLDAMTDRTFKITKVIWPDVFTDDGAYTEVTGITIEVEEHTECETEHSESH